VSPLLARGDVVAARYRVKGVLGRGGMGVVYLAEQLGLGRDVALKIMEGGAEQAPVRFAREAKTLARLGHPGVVGVLDHGRTVDGKYFLAMEHLEGPTLAELLSDHGRLAAGHAVRIASELCDALSYCHGQGVLHRDLKPQNIMLVKDGRGTRVVLIDFGLARTLEDVSITAANACMGSPSYVAPERLSVPAAWDDARSDLYSLGIVLYEMLTGTRPFGDGSALEIAVRQLSVEAPVIEREDVPLALAALVDRLLAKRPEDRYADAASVKSALSRAVTPPVPVAEKAPRAPRPRAMTEVVRAVPKASASLSLERMEAASTLGYRPLRGSGVLRRMWAWWKHGAWRWAG
jgi:serine/threonine protein kinase